jgi:hypothetical protein
MYPSDTLKSIILATNFLLSRTKNIHQTIANSVSSYAFCVENKRCYIISAVFSTIHFNVLFIHI